MTNKNSQKSWKDPITLATVVIAAATVINVIAAVVVSVKTSEYTEVTKNIYKSSNRPYVGINAIDLTKDDANKKLYLKVEYKNYGTVPATNVRIAGNILIDGFKMERTDQDIYDNHAIIFQQTNYIVTYKIASNYYNFLNGKVLLELDAIVKYKGIADEQYQDQEKYRYDNRIGSFIPVEAKTN